MLDDLVQVQFLLVCLFRLSAYRLVSVSALHPFSVFVFLLGRRPVRRFFVVQSVRSCVYLPDRPPARPPMRLSLHSLVNQCFTVCPLSSPPVSLFKSRLFLRELR